MFTNLWITCVLACIIVLEPVQIHAIGNTSTDAVTTNEILQVVCRGNTVPEIHKNACCSFVRETFYWEWTGGGYYLTDYLTTLQNWRCDEYETECKKPTFDFNPFLRLVYDRFCNRTVLMAKCMEQLYTIAVSNHFHTNPLSYGNNDELGITEREWKNITMSLEPAKMDIQELNNPCVQVALFDRPSGGVGRFHEIVQPYTPFCAMTWSGYDIVTAMTRNISPWDSFSMRCRGSIIVCMVVAAVLGIATIIGNLTVVSVYLSVPKLRNSQAVFKISIAIGDLLAGLIVIPNIIIFQYWMFFSPRYMGDIVKENSNTNITTELTRRQPGGRISSILPKGYVSFVGFFTTLSLVVSIYTLLIASIDRFFAIFRPLKYNKAKAKKYAAYTCCVVWLCAAIVASVPLPSMQYKIILSIMASSVGATAVILVAVAFGVPLLALCSINFATYRAARRHAKVRQRLRSSKRTESNKPVEDDMEERLRKILGLMVGVFSICMFPNFLLLILVYMFGNLVFFYPESLDPNAAMIYNSAQYCACFVFLSNSLWNCFIYSARGEDFRNAAKSLAFVKYVSSAASFVASSARRLSDAPNYYRRKSSSSSGLGTGGTASSASTRLSSGDSSVFIHDTSSGASASTYRSRNSIDSVAPRIYFSTNLSKKTGSKYDKEDKTDYATDDSTFGSFAIDAGADRLYLSVMENIEEEVDNDE